MAVRDKDFWIMLIFILCGLVIGGLLGDLASNINGLWWLGYGQEFGITEPFVLNLNILTLTFAFTIKINIASIIGMVTGIIIHRKI